MSGPDEGERDDRGEATPDAPGLVRILEDDQDSLTGATAALEELLGRHAVGGEASYNCALVLEEVVTNIVKYAHVKPGPHQIRFAARLTPRHVILSFDDDGREFDPSAAPPPDLGRPLDERPIGGLGIHLVRRLADRMEYKRVGGRNCLTVFITILPNP
jgi:serine/threonine-protein kinase RsbW